jgi:hypothetical protein
MAAVRKVRPEGCRARLCPNNFVPDPALAPASPRQVKEHDDRRTIKIPTSWGSNLQNDRADQGTVTETNWAGLTVRWDNRSQQDIQHNDMAQIERVPMKSV